MNQQRRVAAAALAGLLERENTLLARQEYERIRTLVPEKQAALCALENSPDDSGEPDTQADIALCRALARLADENRLALLQALRVQDMIMGIMADAARRMTQTPLYGGRGGRVPSRISPAFAMIVQA